MPLHPPTRRREKILVYGRSFSGKSATWLDVAAWLKRTHTKDNTYTGPQMYVGDTDQIWDIFDDGSYPFVHATNLLKNDYRSWIKWVHGVRDVVERDDWVIIDLVDEAWGAAQDYYWGEQGFDLLADVYLRNTQDKDLKTKEAFHMAGDHGTNWGNINFYYNEFFGPVINMQCHLLCTAHAKAVDPKQDPAAMVNEYKMAGWRPAGPGAEKTELKPKFHTVIFTAETGSDKWVYTTVKELVPMGMEGRKMMKGKQVSGFVADYLVGVAGWELWT